MSSRRGSGFGWGGVEPDICRIQIARPDDDAGAGFCHPSSSGERSSVTVCEPGPGDDSEGNTRRAPALCCRAWRSWWVIGGSTLEMNLDVLRNNSKVFAASSCGNFTLPG